MNIKVVTLGCKVNQCESASIVAALNEHGYNASEGLEPADVYVLNTCSVTAEADRKSRQHISKMIKLNSTCKIIVVGCSSQNNAEQFKHNNVFAIGGTTNKSEFVLNNITKLQINNDYNTLSDIILYDKMAENADKAVEYCYEPYPKSNKTRAFVKIQDGCNRFCSYCIIPYLRGRSRSRRIEDVVKECSLSESKEIVLTGIDISSYGRDIGVTFADLINALSGIDARKRLGSFECEIITDDLLKAMGDSGFCPHFHISLQSGSDYVLNSMNRHYNTDFFYGKVELIRKYYPNAGITTDVIVGFPTESENDFKKSCEFIEKCAFSDIHVFPYSSRKGTVASKKYDILPSKIVKERKNALIDIKHDLRNKFLTANLSTSAHVYVEDREHGYNVGYTPNYIKVYSSARCGEICELKLSELFCDGVLGV